MTKVWQCSYYFQINSNTNWGYCCYDGKLDGMKLYEHAICCKIVLTLLDSYEIQKDGVITYVSNEDPKTNIEVICCEKYIKINYDKNQWLYNIKLYTILPFEDKLCDRDPWKE